MRGEATMAMKKGGSRQAVTFDTEVAQKMKQNRNAVMQACGISPQTFYRWAYSRAIPASYHSKLISVLGLRQDQLSSPVEGVRVSKNPPSRPHKQKLDLGYNFTHLINILTEGKCEVVTQDDLIFLAHLESQLPNPLSPQLAAEILKNRHENTQQE